MLLFGVIVICLLLVLLAISIYYNLKCASIIVDVQDATEEALGICDTAYGLMTDTLELPLASDSIEIRQIILHIRNVRDSILSISNILIGPFENDTFREDDNVKD